MEVGESISTLHIESNLRMFSNEIEGNIIKLYKFNDSDTFTQIIKK